MGNMSSPCQESTDASTEFHNGPQVSSVFGTSVSSLKPAAKLPQPTHPDPPPSPPEKQRALYLTESMETVPSLAWKFNIHNPGRIADFYDVKHVLGTGSFGVVSLAHLKATQGARAVKAIIKERMKDHLGALKDEIVSMKKLDHPHVVLLYETFENDESIQLVLEPCRGGDLMGYMVSNGPLPEREVAPIVQQLLRSICYLHRVHVCHRDVKPENVLLANEERLTALSSNSIKLADFGMACVCEPKQFLSHPMGTPSYMAPERFGRRPKYDRSVDLFSVGVLTYYLVCAKLPFEEALEDDRRWYCSYSGKHWAVFSNDGQTVVSFVMALLSLSPGERLDATNALKHPFIDEIVARPPHELVTKAVIHSLVRFRCSNRFTRAALSVVASLLSDAQISSSRRLFNSLDLLGDGLIMLQHALKNMQASTAAAAQVVTKRRDDLEQLSKNRVLTKNTYDDKQLAAMAKKMKRDREALEKRIALALTLQSQLQVQTDAFSKACREVDRETAKAAFADKAQGFTYLEFIAATLDRKEYLTDNVCKAAFAAFDRHGTGVISLKALAAGSLLGSITADEMSDILRDLGKQADQTLDLKEFKDMMQDVSTESNIRGTRKKAPKHQVRPLPRLNKANPRVELQIVKYVSAAEFAPMGQITLELCLFEMPICVSNFLDLAKDGFYDGTQFHVIRGDCLQGGCPHSKVPGSANLGSGSAPPKTTFRNLKYDDEVARRDDSGNIRDEFGYTPTGEFRITSQISNAAGTVAMVNSGLADTGSCQFFINVVNNYDLDWWHPQQRAKSFHHLRNPGKKGQNRGHPVFGRVVAGMDIVQNISRLNFNDPPDEMSVASVTISKVFIPAATLANIELGEAWAGLIDANGKAF